MEYKGKKIAIVCDWLTNTGGAEKVIMALHKLFPEAPLYTTLYDPQRVKGFESATIYTSFLQKIPFSQKKHQLWLAQMPLAIESFDLGAYDIVISSSHAVAKGVITKPSTVHICYCHTPMRYAWEHWETGYRLRGIPKILHEGIKKKLHKLRIWDRLTADRVDHFIANSNYVAQRIKKFYRREAKVIHPPVPVESFHGRENSLDEDYYLMAGRLIPYKRFDLVVDTFNKSGKQLIIIGTGPEEKGLKKRAKKNIRFLGRVSDQELKTYYQNCKALLFPQLEDFGITAIESMASGRPVIAFDQGGAQETIVHEQTGILFSKQTEKSLQKAIEKSESISWNSNLIQKHSEKFSQTAFSEQIQDFISSLPNT